LQAGLGFLKEVGRWTIGSANPAPRSTASTDMSIHAKRVRLGAEVELKGWRFMHCADLEASFVGTAAMSGKQHRQMAMRMNWLHPVESALRKPI
jgi:hypothetical protein